jgi:hypothetical protein
MNDKREPELQGLERRARDAFDASVAALDAPTRSRLNQARQRALAAATAASGSNDARRGWSAWVPAGALAAGVLVAALMLRGPADSDRAPAVAGSQPAALAQEPLELLAAGEEFEIATSDEELEFYEWVEVAAVDAANGQG